MGPRLKVERAKQHIANLDAHIAAFVQRDPYVVVRAEDPDTGDLVWRVRVREQPDPRWGLIAGDAIHNLRSALDHLVWQLVLANGRQPTDETMFPIARSAKQFQAGGLRRIKGVSAQAQAAIQAAQPYKGGNDAFWRLHRLDANDKHRVLYVVGAAHNSVILEFKLPSGDVFPKIGLRPADRQFPLKDGAALYGVEMGGRTDYAENDPQFAFEVALSDGEVVEGEPLLEMLAQLADFTSAFIETFAPMLP